MQQAKIIPIDTKVDVNSLNSIHTNEDMFFTKKNSRPYQELLSNYNKTEKEGWITTNGKQIYIDSVSGTTATFKDADGKIYTSKCNYILEDTINLELPASGELQSIEVYNGYYTCTIKDNSSNYYFCAYNIANKEWEVVRKAGSESVFCIFNSNQYAIGGSSTVSIYNMDGSFAYSMEGVGSNANNGALIKSRYVVGRDTDNQADAWFAIRNTDGTVTKYNYLGCISKKGFVTGEPVPVSDTSTYTPLTTVTKLSNGVLRWTIDSTNEDTALANNVSTLGSISKNLPTTITNLANATQDYTYSLRAQSRTTYRWCGMVNVWTNSYPTIVSLGGSGQYQLVDPNATPGIFWSTTKSTYDNVFPYMYVFSNVASNKGKVFDYGRDWLRAYSLSLTVTTDSATANGHTVSLPSIHTGSLLMYDITGGENGLTNSKFYNMDNTVDNYTTDSTYTSVRTSPIDDGKLAMFSAAITQDRYRPHPVTYDILQNKAWPDFLHIIGGTNSGQYGLCDVLPFYRDDGLVQLLYYSNILMGVSFVKCLLGTSTTDGISNYAKYTSGNKTYVATDKTIYIIDTGSHTKDDIKVHKVADFNFATNILSEANLFQETRDGKLSLERSFIPYNGSMVFNLSTINNSGWYSPEDGGSTNDIWYSASGVNSNLNDKYTSSSYLLPAIEIPIYVYSENLSDFNRKIIDGNNPIVSPTTASLLYTDEELENYYTHSLSSTDITYKYTLKGNDIYFDSDYADNTWWITSDIQIYPIGIGSDLSGINYIAPTVDLGNNYSARLYTKDNQVFMAINATNQVFYGSTIFTIYTSSYYYDGQAIYYIGGTNENTSNSFSCYAIGMKFIGNSPTEAYFYSEFDKSIYTFTGSNTLNKTTPCAQLNGIKDTMFSSPDQTLYILDNNNQLFFMDSSTSGLIQLDEADHLENTTKGAAVLTNSGYILYTPYGGEELLPLELETEWLGDPTCLYRVGYFDIYLYNNNITKPISVKAYIKTEVDTVPSTYVNDITIYPKDFEHLDYRLRIEPDNPIGNAFKFGLYTEDPIAISYMTVAMEQVSSTPATRR